MGNSYSSRLQAAGARSAAANAAFEEMARALHEVVEATAFHFELARAVEAGVFAATAPIMGAAEELLAQRQVAEMTTSLPFRVRHDDVNIMMARCMAAGAPHDLVKEKPDDLRYDLAFRRAGVTDAMVAAWHAAANAGDGVCLSSGYRHITAPPCTHPHMSAKQFILDAVLSQAFRDMRRRCSAMHADADMRTCVRDMWTYVIQPLMRWGARWWATDCSGVPVVWVGRLVLALLIDEASGQHEPAAAISMLSCTMGGALANALSLPPLPPLPPLLPPLAAGPTCEECIAFCLANVMDVLLTSDAQPLPVRAWGARLVAGILDIQPHLRATAVDTLRTLRHVPHMDATHSFLALLVDDVCGFDMREIAAGGHFHFPLFVDSADIAAAVLAMGLWTPHADELARIPWPTLGDGWGVFALFALFAGMEARFAQALQLSLADRQGGWRRRTPALAAWVRLRTDHRRDGAQAAAGKKQ